MRIKYIISVLVVGSIFSGCKENNVEKENTTKSPGFEVANMDKNISPQEDFNLYVNGSWIKNNPVPSTETRWGSFNEVTNLNQTYLRKILEEAASKTDHEKGSNLQKIGDFYYTAMDSVSLNSKGVSDLKDKVAMIDEINDHSSLMATMARLSRHGIKGVIGFYVSSDSKNSNEHISYIYQSGLSLPDRDYYLASMEPYLTWQEKYKVHVSNMLAFLGEENTAEKAEAIYNVERKIAEISMDRVTRRNPDTTYNKMSFDELKQISTAIDWDSYLKNLGNVSVDSVVVRQLFFVKEIQQIIASTSVDVWKDYLKWKLIKSTSNYLSDEISLESFNFYAATLRGAKEQKPRWKRAIESSDSHLGEILGQEYVKVAFSQEAKDQVYEMVDMLQEAYADRIKNLDWMSEETKKMALHKLSTFTRKLGYPDVWKDMSALNFDRSSYVINIFNVREFMVDYMLNKLGKPVDRNEWGMTPSTVNAYYNPSKNEIVFPAGIMQPPFFDPNADAAVNFGGIGAVIGHELSHGFDDQGAKYDADGNLKNWWTEEDKEKFNQRTAKLKAQFDAYTVLDSIQVNGSLTMGENIADLGGVTMSYYAYQKYLEKYGRQDIEGYTPEQRFFIGWAQVWRMTYTDQELLRRIKTDPHSPGMFRANAPISNFVPFYEAWEVKEENAMYRHDSIRVEIW